MKRSIIICMLSMMFMAAGNANNIQIFNVSLINKDVANQTIQVQFDLSWENSWRDEINWDAAWVFIKYRNSEDVWRHALLSTGGAQPGSGTPAIVQVTSDLVGAFVYRSAVSEGTFEVNDLQLRWNYGIHGETNPEDLEVRVFALEMVYVPEGKFAMRRIIMKTRYAQRHWRPYDFFCINSGAYPVISERWTPKIEVKRGNSDGLSTPPMVLASTIRIKGNEGMDYNADGTIDNPNYPTGYKAFYMMKYEATEDLYAGFYNTLNAAQRTSLGMAGSNITQTDGVYFSSTPNRASVTGNSNFENKTLALGDWTGLRPMTMFEYNKAAFGPMPPSTYAWGNSPYSGATGLSGQETGTETATSASANVHDFRHYSFRSHPVRSGIFARETTNRAESGASYYGIMEMMGNANEPAVYFDCQDFDGSHGNGELNPTSGLSTNPNWKSNKIIYVGAFRDWYTPHGFRYVRSAE